MKKKLKRVSAIIMTMALMIALIPIQALASDTVDTLSNIPIYINDGENESVQGNAILKLTEKKYESIYHAVNSSYSITSKVGDKLEGLGPRELETTMDDGYGLVEMYMLHLDGIKSGEFGNGTTINGTLTVPVPEGCFATGAKRIYNWAWHMDHVPDYEKVDVTVNADGTISFPVVMWTVYDYTDEVNNLNGVYVVEYKKTTDISTLASKASLAYGTSEFTGSAISPKVTITGLTENTDFTVAYSKNINVGDSKAIITGKGIYVGTLELPFKITPMSIQKKQADAKLLATEFDYTGQAITPEVQLAGLSVGKDFTVEYANNIEPGTATATIKGIGNYNSSFVLEFKIKEKPVEEKPTEVKDNTGADYSIKTTSDVSEATYESAKSNNEKTVNIPDTIPLPDGSKAKVTAIAKNACKGNKKLTKVTMGKNVKTVGDNAFNGCSKLSNLKFGKNVERIGNGAVRNCSSLKKVTLPASTKTIDKNAFDGDSNLKELTINCKNLKSVGKNAIRNINPRAVIKLKGNAKQKNAAEKLITKKGTGYKKTMKIKK